VISISKLFLECKICTEKTPSPPPLTTNVTNREGRAYEPSNATTPSSTTTTTSCYIESDDPVSWNQAAEVKSKFCQS